MVPQKPTTTAHGKDKVLQENKLQSMMFIICYHIIIAEKHLCLKYYIFARKQRRINLLRLHICIYMYNVTVSAFTLYSLPNVLWENDSNAVFA